MAAPTNVRVESNSLTTAVLRWTYPGASQIQVWRSLTSGSGFAEITEATTRIDPGTTTYTDTTVEPGIRYFYKLTDDAGSTFSSEVSVVAQSCLPPAGSLDTFSLPRLDPAPDLSDLRFASGGAAPSSGLPSDMMFTGGTPYFDERTGLPRTPEVVEKFNNLAERVEAVLHGRVLVPGDCIACPTNGALVLNCAAHCKQWLIVADEDINSISLQYCDEGPGNIDFIIPSGETRRIDGWPDGFGFGGDEGFQAPVSGGTEGRTVSVGSSPGGRANSRASGSRPGTSRGIGPGSGGGSAGAGSCPCTAIGGNLTIKSCNANNSLNCQSTKSLQLKACGGLPPYTWSNTGSVNLSTTTGSTTTVTPPTNSGSGVAGTAYNECHYGNNGGFGCGTQEVIFNDKLQYGCNDQLLGCTNIGGGCGAVPSNQNMPCITGLGSCSIPQCTDCSTHVDFKQSATDVRTAGMITDGCNPCGVHAGATVTVTDSVGTQTTVILRQ